MQTYNRRGSFSSFKMTFDDTRLLEAIHRFGSDAETEMSKIMRIALESSVRDTQEILKRMAKPDATAVVPMPGRKSKPIHVRVAEAMKVHQINKLEFAVHTGKTYAQREEGVKGSRGGKLAHIVAKGMKSFRYGRLPPLVYSSVPYYAVTGVNRDTSGFMKMRVYHPGFGDVFDFIGYSQGEALARMQEMGQERIFQIATTSGFYGSAREAEAGMRRMNLPSLSHSIRSAIGGKGLQVARRRSGY